MKTITKHYIDGAFVESHGREVMDIINPSNGKVIARATLADEEDARRAIAAAKRAFVSFGQTTKKERAKVLRRLHEVVVRAPREVHDLVLAVDDDARRCVPLEQEVLDRPGKPPRAPPDRHGFWCAIGRQHRQPGVVAGDSRAGAG